MTSVTRASQVEAISRSSAGFISRMPRYQLPRDIEFVTKLPRTPTGKVRKAELRKAVPSESTTWERTAFPARCDGLFVDAHMAAVCS